MSRFRLSSEAENDLDSIRRYLTQRSGARSARYVLRELRQALQLLADAPEIGHRREDLTDAPVKFWPVFSYLIVYDPATQPIGVARVIHGHQDIETMFREHPPHM